MKRRTYQSSQVCLVESTRERVQHVGDHDSVTYLYRAKKNNNVSLSTSCETSHGLYIPTNDEASVLLIV